MTATIELACDEAGAVISPIGASLVRFSVGDRPVVVPMNAFDGAVLAPWPNRIDAGRFDFAGDSHRLPITEPERDTALHGLVADVPWSVVERTESGESAEALERVREWMAENREALVRTSQVLRTVSAMDQPDLAPLSVALRTLRGLVRQGSAD